MGKNEFIVAATDATKYKWTSEFIWLPAIIRQKTHTNYILPQRVFFLIIFTKKKPKVFF